MISIVIPTFNEVENIIPLLKNLTALVNDFEYEIIVVDDDSPDGTSDEINKYMKLNKRIKLITRIGRSGLSSAIKEGLIFAQGKYLLVLDGDGQHHPSFIALDKPDLPILVINLILLLNFIYLFTSSDVPSGESSSTTITS